MNTIILFRKLSLVLMCMLNNVYIRNNHKWKKKPHLGLRTLPLCRHAYSQPATIVKEHRYSLKKQF